MSARYKPCPCHDTRSGSNSDKSIGCEPFLSFPHNIGIVESAGHRVRKIGSSEFERGRIRNYSSGLSERAPVAAVYYFMFATRPRLPHSRSLASLSPSHINTASRSPYQVFDRHAKRLQKDRAAARDGGNRSRTVDYVRDEVANTMIERFMASIHSGFLFI